MVENKTTQTAATRGRKAHTMPARYDVVYFWMGGSLNEWREATPNVFPDYLSVDTLVGNIEKGGRVAVRGNRNVGAPEGAPA